MTKYLLVVLTTEEERIRELPYKTHLIGHRNLNGPETGYGRPTALLAVECDVVPEYQVFRDLIGGYIEGYSRLPIPSPLPADSKLISEDERDFYAYCHEEFLYKPIEESLFVFPACGDHLYSPVRFSPPYLPKGTIVCGWDRAGQTYGIRPHELIEYIRIFLQQTLPHMTGVGEFDGVPLRPLLASPSPFLLEDGTDAYDRAKKLSNL